MPDIFSGPVTARPSIRIRPRDGSCRPVASFMKVDLPQPEGPTMALNAPWGTCKSMASTANGPRNPWPQASQTSRKSTKQGSVAGIDVVAQDARRRMKTRRMQPSNERCNGEMVGWGEMVRWWDGGMVGWRLLAGQDVALRRVGQKAGVPHRIGLDPGLGAERIRDLRGHQRQARGLHLAKTLGTRAGGVDHAVDGQLQAADFQRHIDDAVARLHMADGGARVGQHLPGTPGESLQKSLDRRRVLRDQPGRGNDHVA